jgi:hypothetical protein
VTDWSAVARRAAFESHRLIGWIYWDPTAIDAYGSLGIPGGSATSRAAPCCGPMSAAAFTRFILISCGRASTAGAAGAGPTDAMRVRDDAVLAGMAIHAQPCAELSDLAGQLWVAADSLPLSGRPVFATHLRHRRDDEPLLSAWLAVNCIREWRGDTHWALHVADDLTGIEAGVLDGAWRLRRRLAARSRGRRAALAEAYARLEARGLADDGPVNEAGRAHRQRLEDRLDHLAAGAWRHLGEATTQRFVDLVATVGDALMARVDATAGDKWMPAGRPPAPPSAHRSSTPGEAAMSTVSKRRTVPAVRPGVVGLADFGALAEWTTAVDHSCC